MQLVNNAVINFIMWIRTSLGSERGQDLLEYAMLGGLIAAAIAALLAAGIFSGALKDMANGIRHCIDFSTAAGSECTGGL